MYPLGHPFPLIKLLFTLNFVSAKLLTSGKLLSSYNLSITFISLLLFNNIMEQNTTGNNIKNRIIAFILKTNDYFIFGYE